MIMTGKEIVESKHLAYWDSYSDKVYNVFLIKKDEGQYVVNFAYGRRGARHLNTGTKTFNPVSLEKAQAIYGKLIRDKMNKGYN